MTLHPDIERVALLGWHLYPCSNRSRKGCFKGATDAATCDLDQLERWQREFPRCNWRVVCGPSGIWGLDCDAPSAVHKDDGVGALRELVERHGPIPPRPQLRSGGGGIAMFFAYHGERIIGKTGHPRPGIDPRRGRLSQTIPPSTHVITRQPYRWVDPPWKINPPVAPKWLVDLVREPDEPVYKAPPAASADQARNKLYRAADAVARASEGSRNDTLNRRSYQVGIILASGLLAEQEAYEALYGAARVAGLDHAGAKATIRSGINSGLRRGVSG